MRTIFKRLSEMLFLCFTMSPITCALYYYKWIPNTRAAYGITLLIVTIIFIIANVLMLRRCFFDLRDTWQYYILNYIAYGIFILITVAVNRIFGELPYAWMFNTLKLVTFTDFGLSPLRSTFFTHGIMLLIIAVAPIGMDWVFDLPDEIFEEDEDDFDDDFEEAPEDLPPEE